MGIPIAISAPRASVVAAAKQRRLESGHSTLGWPPPPVLCRGQIVILFTGKASNCNRHPADLTTRKPNYDNVFLEDVAEAQAGSSRLVAMDYTHCFTCGRDLDETVAHIEKVK